MNTVKRVISPLNNKSEQNVKKQKLSSSTENLSKLNTLNDQKENFDFLFDESCDFDLGAIESAEQSVEHVAKLDLSKWQRCLVVQIERDRKSFDLVLSVALDERKNLEAYDGVSLTKCHLQGPWCNTHIDAGDVVSIKAIWDDDLKIYKVNKDFGYCVTYPDTLISGTTVVGSLFCRRKAVLQERFRGIDANDKVMVIGTLVHELLQIVLEKQLTSFKEIETACNELLESQETAYALYSSLLTREDASLEVIKFVSNIFNFVQQYIVKKDPTVLQKDTFQGSINKIEDIEENLWIPQLGLKGKVDVSVRIHRRKNNLKFEPTNTNAIPLELKTGRATFSMEHKGQLILYQMMLSTLGRDINSGLLLYLREGIMREISGARNEQRDLIALRNDLAYYLSYIPNLPPVNVPNALGDGKYIQSIKLPDPISHHSACNSCAYANLCCTFARTDKSLELNESHPLRKVMHDVTAHLKPTEYEYFMHWCRLIFLEDIDDKKANVARSLWTDTPEIRQQNGRAVIDLELLNEVSFEGSRYLHTFKLKTEKEEDMDLTLSCFACGMYVIVSSRQRLAIAAGHIFNITNNTISISLERNLNKNYKGQSFIVDKHVSQSVNVFNYTNLGLMLDETDRAKTLRDIVVHKKQPTYTKKLPSVIAEKGKEILKMLNMVQRKAVLKALTTDSFMLIKGLPGTGKTQTLVALIQLLNLIGKTVIITSHTHSAVDNLLLRLKNTGLKMLRLGSGERIHTELQECSESEVTKDCKTEAELAKKYASYNIIGVTCLGASHSIFLHRKFDYCIVDESTQVMQCTVLRPLFFCSKFILVGDPDQLPPLIRSKEANTRGASESLFERLDNEKATSVLNLQYRMNKSITKLANELTYGGALECGSKEVQLAALNFKMPVMVDKEKWLERVMQTHIDQSVLLLDTLDCAERSRAFAMKKHSRVCEAIEQTFASELDNDENSNMITAENKRISKYTNYCEAAIIFYIVEVLLRANFKSSRIGIIAPYRAQVELLRKLSTQYNDFYKTNENPLDFSAVEVNTVDQYQGRDKDIILYSGTKTGSVSEKDIDRQRDNEILEDKRRLTVAITRSKHKLILVGDTGCLAQYTPFQKMFKHIPSYCCMKLEDSKLGFNWQKLLNKLSEVISK